MTGHKLLNQSGPSKNEVISPTFIVTDLLTSLGEKNQEPDYLVSKGNDLITLLKSNPYIKDDLVIGAFGHRLQTLLTHTKKEVVATGYRVSRYIISSQDTIKSLIGLRVDVLMIVSLAKSHSYDIEREQALKLLRAFIDIPNGYKELTKGLCASVYSIAGQSDDRLRNISIETCCEICLLRPDLIPPSSLIQFIVEDPSLPFDIVLSVSFVMLKLVNTPEGRNFFTPGDIKKLISPITDFDQVDLHRMDNLNNTQKRIQRGSTYRLNSTCGVIANIFKSFNGLYIFSLNDFDPMKTLLRCLRYPDHLVVSRVLDLLLDALLIKEYDMNTGTAETHLCPLDLKNLPIMKTQYVGLLISVLLSCDIIDNLVYTITKGMNEINSTKAGFLLIDLHRISCDILPESLCQYFENIFDSLQSSNTDIVYLLEGISRKSNAGAQKADIMECRYSCEKQTKLRNNLNPLKMYGVIDDIKLRQILSDTKVLSSKNFAKWDCDIIEALFEGPLLSGKRLEEVNKTSKFIKRLLSFFRPFKNKFSATRKSKSTKRFVNLGCTIFKTLIQTSEGVKTLQESKILPQIAECLAQIDPYSGFYAKDQIFSRERLSNTLSGGYFKMLGVLTKDQRGFDLIEKWKIFSMIFHISDDSFRRDDVLILFLDNISFPDCENAIVILEKCIRSQNHSLKIHSLRVLKKMLCLGADNTHDSSLELIISVLYESIFDEESRAIIIESLIEYSDLSQSHLAQIISLLPNIDVILLQFRSVSYYNMNEMGLKFILRFLSISEGFNFLNKSGFIDKQFQMWINGGKYLSYVKNVETLLLSHNKLSPPTNIFEELVKTEEGLNMVLNSGILAELVGTIKQYAILLNQNAISELVTFGTTKLKASIWCVGFISGTYRGYEKLDSYGCIVDVMDICRKSPFLDIKATCFYVFGTFSKSTEGSELLDTMAWQIKTGETKSYGVAIPLNIGEFIKPFDSQLTPVFNKGATNLLQNFETHDKVLQVIIQLISGLCSHINFDKYSNELFIVSKSHPDYFKQPEVFYLVLTFFEYYNYRYTIRKFILELFLGDGKILDALLKRSKKRTKDLGASKA